MADTAIKIPGTIIVRDLADKLGIPAITVTTELIKNGVMASINAEIDFDTAAIIADDLGKHIVLDQGQDEPVSDIAEINYLTEDPTATLTARPPVVVVMGLVDHGKTSLLDAIRETAVTAGEAGGITQHIGAYQVERQNRLITFIDTPGHEAFTKMRARGAKIADVAIVVVAADDGMKPQTDETLKIVRAANLPFIVAITKVDKADANIDKVKKELSEHDVLPEEWGGKVPFVSVSAKEKTGLAELLEAVLLLADVDSSGLMVNPKRPAVGTIIESHVDPQQGALASVLIQTGTLRVGDEVVVGQVWGKIRSLKNDRGETVTSAVPSSPVQILGLKAAPQVGDVLRVDAKEVLALKKKVKSHQLGHHVRSVVNRDTLSMPTAEGEEAVEVPKVFMILKADTLGSSEAVLESLKKLPHDEVSLEIVQRGLGIISEADVLRAEGAKAHIYGFNVQVSQKADQLARNKGVQIKSFNVIYDLIDDVVKELELLLPPTIERKEMGRLNVLAIFRNENTFQVVGGKVMDGVIANGDDVEVRRGDKVVSTGKITQLQANKQNIKEVSEGTECGMKIEGKPVIAVSDQVYAIRTISTPRTLLSV